MATAIKWFSAAFGAGFGAGFAIIASAAPGDAIYEEVRNKNITPAQAACYGSCSVSDGSWDGDPSGLQTIRVSRNVVAGVQGFRVSVNGLKSAPLADVPDGSVIRGVSE